MAQIDSSVPLSTGGIILVCTAIKMHVHQTPSTAYVLVEDNQDMDTASKFS